MKITKITMYPQEELIHRLREVTLTDGVTKPYAKSDISICRINFHDINFAQSYVLKSDFEKIRKLNDSFLQFGFNIANIPTYFDITLNSGENFPYIPPIIEWAEGEGNYVSDGMHRLSFIHSFFEIHPAVVLVKNPSKPYYAYSTYSDWDNIPDVDERPKFRKTYRDPDNYKALFRDYNSQFPGIQRDRSKDK